MRLKLESKYGEASNVVEFFVILFSRKALFPVCHLRTGLNGIDI